MGHVLGPFHDLSMHPEEVGLLEGFEAKVVVAEVPLVVYGFIQLRGIPGRFWLGFSTNPTLNSKMLLTKKGENISEPYHGLDKSCASR